MALKKGLAAGLVLLLQTHAIWAQDLSHMIPCGGKRGGTTRVTFFGKGAEQATTVWTTFSAVVRPTTAPMARDQITFDVTIPESQPPGLHAVRLAGPSSLSEPRSFIIDDYSVQAAERPRQAAGASDPLRLPVSVGGMFQEGQADYFHFSAVQGETLSFEVFGERLGNASDPLMRILDDGGREIAFRDNEPGFGLDVRFAHRFEKSGDYRLEVRDTRFGGGVDWMYHLRIGRFPTAKVATPFIAAASRRTTVEFLAGNEMKKVDVGPFSDHWLTRGQVVLPGADGSSWTPIGFTTMTVAKENEPNNEPARATPITLPAMLTGRFDRPADVDYFRFTAIRGTEIRFAAESRAFSSLADVLLRVRTTAGDLLLEADDDGPADARVTFTAPADGDYLLMLEDLNRRGGPEFPYALQCQPGKKELAIVAVDDRLVVPRGGLAPVRLAITRIGQTGPIELACRSEKPGLTLTTGAIPEGRSEMTVAVMAAAETPPGPAVLHLTGTIAADAGPVATAAIIRPALAPGPSRSGRQTLPPDLEHAIAVLVVDPPPVRLAAKSDRRTIARYSDSTLTVSAMKTAGFDSPVAISLAYRPEGITIEGASLDRGQGAADFPIRMREGTALGPAELVVRGEFALAGKTTTVFAAPVSIDIRPAFAVACEAKLSVKQGESAKATVNVSRLPEFSGPIVIQLKNPPKGVAAAKLQIGAGQSHGEVILNVAKDAPTIKEANLEFIASAKINGITESVAGPTIVLSVP